MTTSLLARPLDHENDPERDPAFRPVHPMVREMRDGLHTTGSRWEALFAMQAAATDFGATELLIARPEVTPAPTAPTAARPIEFDDDSQQRMAEEAMAQLAAIHNGQKPGLN